MSYYYGSNNVLAMYIDGSGAVGFGTSNTSNAPGYVTFSNPISVLSGIQNPNASYTGNITDGPGMPSFTWYDTSNYGMFRASNNAIGFSTFGLERARIDSTGRLGVGLSNPQYLLDVAGGINALGYCNLLSNVVNSTSIYTAPTNNALNNVNLQSTWGCNLAVSTSNIIFNPATNPNNTQGNYTCNLAVTTSNQLYPIAIYSSNYISSNIVTFSNLSLISSLSNSGNIYSACNMVLGCNLNLTSLCNFGTSYFASNVTHSNTFSNLGSVYFASNLNINSNLIVSQNTTVSNTLSNLGNVYFASNLNINSNLIVSQNIVGNNTLSNLGNVYFASNLNINSNLIVSQNIVGSNTLSNLGNVYFASNLNINSNLLVSQNIVGSNTLSNLGSVYFASNLVLGCNLNLTSLCNLGTSYFASNVTHSNTFSNLGNVYFASNLKVNSNVYIGQNGFIGINNSNPGSFLDIIGNQDLMASFCNINGSPYIRFLCSNGGGLIGIAGVSNAILPGSIQGDVVLKSYSNMSNLGRILIGNGTNNPVITVSNAYVGIGTLYPQNTLDVSGIINSYIGITNSGYTSNTGNASFSSNVVVNSNLTVTQNVFSSNTLSNLGNAFFASNMTINSNLTVSQNIVGSNTFSNLGNVYFASNLVMNGSLAIANPQYSQFTMMGASNSATGIFAFNDGTTYFQGKNNISITPYGSLNAYIYINSNSRFVGINNVNPQYILDVSGNANVSNNVNTGSVNISNSPSNTLSINSKNSQSTFGQIIFTNTSATGDLRITGDGGDLFWQGGGGRTLQMAAYHGITLMGGRTTGTAPVFVNGSGSLYNTAIQNTNNSIGLIVQGTTGQTSDLMQYKNVGGTVVSRVNSNGLCFDSNNNPPTNGNKINMLALSNSTGTYTPSTGVNTINVQIVGAGGGGGGATGNASAAGGGGAGGNCIAWITNISVAASYSYTIGTGGVGTTGLGSNGGNSSITVNSVVYMGIGGGGGQGIASANSASLGGVGGSTSNGLITNYGASGRAGVNGYYTVVSGTGGSTAFGQGGEGRLSAGPGSVGQGYGAGGGGGVRNTASMAGGNGANGIIIIEEYT